MNRGDSRVSAAGINALLYDFVKVISAQHALFYSQALDENNAFVRINLHTDSNLFESLGLSPQPAATQWMLIIKLYRLHCLKEINADYDGGSPMDVESFMNYQFDYEKMNNEVELVLIPETFNALLRDDKLSPSVVAISEQPSYTCRIFLRDNKVMLSVNESKFQVARINAGSMMERLLIALLHLPSSETLNMINFDVNRNDLDFIRIIKKNNYSWLEIMLPVLRPSEIALKNPIELSMAELLAMLPEIAENYRKPIASYLGINDNPAE